MDVPSSSVAHASSLRYDVYPLSRKWSCSGDGEKKGERERESTRIEGGFSVNQARIKVPKSCRVFLRQYQSTNTRCVPFSLS